MTRFDVAVLAVRLLALYVGYEVLQFVLSLAYLLARVPGWEPRSGQVLSLILAMVLLAGFAVALFLLAPAMARRIFPGSEPVHSMSGPEVGLLGLKICGLFCLASFIEELGGLPEYLKPRGDEFPRDLQDFYLLMVAVHGVLAALLILGAPFLSRRLFGSPAAAPGGSLLQRVQPVAFSVVGLYLAGTSLLPVAEELIRPHYIGDFGFSAADWAQLVVGVLGLLLFVGGGPLARFWQWLHRAGLKPQPQTPP